MSNNPYRENQNPAEPTPATLPVLPRYIENERYIAETKLIDAKARLILAKTAIINALSRTIEETVKHCRNHSSTTSQTYLFDYLVKPLLDCVKVLNRKDEEENE